MPSHRWSPAITSIELEHTDRLGGTLAAIAGEKAGIVKPGVPCVVGALPPEALDVVLARAAAVGAPVLRLGQDFTIECADGPPADPWRRIRFAAQDGARFEAALPLLGAHQVHNAALAIACVRALGAYGDAQLGAAVAAGFGAVHLPGRLEVVDRSVAALLVDAAHTPASAARLAEVLRRCSRAGCDLVLSISGDKDAKRILEVLLPEADVLWATRAEPIRSMPPETLARASEVAPSSAGIEVHVEPAVATRLRMRSPARDVAGRRRSAAAGSVYLAGAARSFGAHARGPGRSGLSSAGRGSIA